MRPDQRVLPHQVDVIGDQHQLAGMKFGIDGAGGVGEDHAIDAALGQLANAQGDFGAGIAFVIMGAAGEHHHVGFAQAAGDQLAGVSRGGDGRPSRDIRVRGFKTILKGFGKRAQAAAENNSNATHNNIPAMQADMKFAMVPAATAFSPSRATSDLREGASAPIPPTWMATELRLAKPHSA